MIKIGFVLVNSQNQIVRTWLGTEVDGNGRPLINFVIPGTSDAVHSPTLGQSYNTHKLIELWEDRPSYDPLIQIQEGPTNIVQFDRIIKTYTVRNKTAQELDDDKITKVNAIDNIQFQVLFNHENRIRTLAGQASVTANQFRNGIKALL